MPVPRRPVPELRVPTRARGDFDLAAEAPKLFTLISFYRRFHCPVRLKYLRDLESPIPEYERRGTKLIAVSSDRLMVTMEVALVQLSLEPSLALPAGALGV
jgi:hypothetical protein